MLIFLDILYTVLHLIIIVFNLTGWMFESTRKVHLFVVGITCFCWLILGIRYGFGYCPLTEWQWEVKARLGENDLPASFITFLINNLLGGKVSENLITNGTGIVFLVVVVITVYLNFFKRRNFR